MSNTIIGKKEEFKAMPAARKSVQINEDGEEIRPKFLSNHTHYSPTDPDAKISTKPGKPRQLNYAGQLAVDDKHHVITGACASTAGSKDSAIFSEIMNQTLANFKSNEMQIDQVLADAGYSSGDSLQYCEDNNIDILVNTNPNVKALFTKQKKTNINAFKKEEIKRYFLLKASEQIAKAMKRKPTEAVKGIVKIAPFEPNAVVK